ncbi:FlgO family outer membrane protein [uncultured Desulfovibrio sp.]|uniref:FlgO family outer membrane protein n=1 Tax=uncultured Desulfovibrio sp. TaxID=167968 RepID=UPI00262DC35C|nr:FlgO family outer membrane protein [uncultured Desulfovibrio sp.]
MSRFLVIILVLAALLFPLTAAAGTVPSAADRIARQLDEQLMMRYASDDSDMSKKQRQALARSQIMIMGTTPANINNLQAASPLARQMTEEISRWLVNAGYRYQELRKGSYIRFDRGTGELILTREVRKLTSTRGTGQAILAGTYVVSGEQVRFSMSLIHTTSNEVLAKGTATVPITDDLLPLLEDQPLGSGKVPTVYTRLQ